MANIIRINRNFSLGQVILMNVKDKLKLLRQSSPNDLLYKFDLGNVFPVDIMKLLEKLDIKVIPYDFSNLEKNDYKNQVIEKGIILGAAVHSGDRIGLFYRQDDSEKRKRFTLAHELAHCCLHMDENTPEHIEFRNDQANINDKKEYDANIFAGELLIPEGPLRYALENLIMPKVEILAQIFGVSLNVMKARLKYLNIDAYE